MSAPSTTALRRDHWAACAAPPQGRCSGTARSRQSILLDAATPDAGGRRRSGDSRVPRPPRSASRGRWGPLAALLLVEEAELLFAVVFEVRVLRLENDVPGRVDVGDAL